MSSQVDEEAVACNEEETKQRQTPMGVENPLDHTEQGRAAATSFWHARRDATHV